MNRNELVNVVKDSYQKGYRDGFMDACDLMRTATTDLAQSMEEGLLNSVTAVDTEEVKNENTRS